MFHNNVVVKRDIMMTVTVIIVNVVMYTGVEYAIRMGNVLNV